MGAHSFLTTARADSAAEAFKAAVEQAHYDHGHDPYNGTISTVSTYRMVPEGTEDPEGWCIENAQKWEWCGCWRHDDDQTLWHFAGWAAS